MTKKNSVADNAEVTPEDVVENTAAADTLKPGAGSGGSMKMQTLNLAIAAIAGMNQEDLSHFYNDTLALFGKYSQGAPVTSDQMAATIQMKPSAAVGGNNPIPAMPMPSLSKEELETLFGSELTEESQLKVNTLFEAAVSTAISIEKIKLEEAHAVKLEEEVKLIREDLEDKTDKYLTYAVNEWVKDNEVAIQNTLRTEKAEKFIDALKKTFSEHYVDLPEDKVDMVADLQKQVNELKDKLNESVKASIDFAEEVNALKKKEIFNTVSEGLALTQVEKLRNLSETVDADSLEEYSKKLAILKESTFVSSKTPAKSNILTEEFTPDETKPNTVSVDPTIQRYVDAVSKTVRK